MTAPETAALRARRRRGYRSCRAALFSAVILTTFAACGSDANAPGVSPAATIILSGVPTAALRTGGSAQLSATVLSGTGSTISGVDVAWKSSNETVATVSRSGLVTAIAGGRATVTASSGSASASAEIAVLTVLTVTPGGTATLADGSVSLSLPSANSTMTLLVGPGAASLADDKVVPGTIFQINPESGGPLFSGASISVRYDATRLPAGVTANGLQLYIRTGSTWTAIRRSVSDLTQRLVTGTFSLFGTYAVRYTSVDRLVLSGGQLDEALYAGQASRLVVAAVSTLGDTLPNRTATWSTSAPSVAAVDAQGTVTGLGPGTVTITATTDGATATKQFQVLSRPIASWTGDPAWTTFRGNNRRTGYVDATLDPVVFSRRWEVTLATTVNEPATGDGNVYVTSGASYGGQAVWALNASTGSTRWTRAFGAISSVNGPAAGNGRVYVSTGGHQDSFLWSFDAADGSVKFRSPYGNQWSRWQAPAVTSDIVFFGGGFFGGIEAFDALDGHVHWYRDLPQDDAWTPAVDAGKVYAFGAVGSASGLLAMDRTGNALVIAPNLGLPKAATPVIGGANDVYGIRNSRMFAIDLSRNVVAWDLPGAYQGTPAVDGTAIYAVMNGQVEARRRSDGGLLWTWVPPTGSAARGSTIITRNLLFVPLIPAGFPSNPARIVAIDLATRKVVWSYEADGEIALGDGLLVITGRAAPKVTAIAVR
jgi:hypothetical protein